jgi:hypothetical protein
MKKEGFDKWTYQRRECKFMENIFCIILSKYRLYQGIALYRSLVYNYPEFKMVILCVDDETHEICSKLGLERATLLKEADLLNEALIIAKGNRRLNEYCWTLKPFLLEYVLQRFNNAANVIYMDADICFFNDPKPLFNQNAYNILLSEHDYLDKDLEVEAFCGKYNSGFIVFRNCPTSLKALSWWKDKCLDWCYDVADEEKFGDQKYLEKFPVIFDKVYSIATPGINIAPWNDSKYMFQYRGSDIYVNDSKLICYHFCGFRVMDKNTYALLVGNQNPNPIIHNPYTAVLQQVIKDMDAAAPNFEGYFVEKQFQNRIRIYKMTR